MEFFKWLFLNYHNRPEVKALDDVQAVSDFLDRNKHVLWPSKSDEDKWANLRLEPRIENDVSVEVTVIQCDEIELIGNTVTGRTLDIGLHGMRLTATEDIPRGTIVKLSVTKEGPTDKSYNLSAELRWTTKLEEGHLVGVKLQETAEFEQWKADFGKEFVAPVRSGRRKRS